MKIYLIDVNEKIIEEWKKLFNFNHIKDVIIVHQDLHSFLNSHPNIEAIVSPANSFGIMMGGYDLAITKYFGNELQTTVQKYINDNLYGEQTVGTSISVKIPNTDKYLIHTPSMRTPSVIKDPEVIYNCMRNTLIEAYKLNVDSILIPAFGGLTGCVEPEEVAWQMFCAYRQINDYIVNLSKNDN